MSVQPPSWRPAIWQERFIASLEPRLLLLGHGGCGKRRCLIEAAAVGHEDPIWRGVIIGAGQHARSEIIQEAGPIYARRSGVYSAEFGHEWRFQASGAIVRVAGSVEEARCAVGYDMVCLDHLEEFGDSQISAARRLLRKVPGRKPRMRATRRSDRPWQRHFPERIVFDEAGDADPFAAEENPESTDLERLVLALTAHQHKAGSAATWEAVRDAVQVMAPGPHDRETTELVRAVEARDGDERRLLLALDRARHHLAEMHGSEPGACHATCAPSCSLRQTAQGYSVEIAAR